MIRGPPGSTLFPYPTLSRSRPAVEIERPQFVQRAIAFVVVETLRAIAVGRRRGSVNQRRRPTAMARRVSTTTDRKSTRLNSSHQIISYAVFCLKKKNNQRKL